MKAVGLYDPAFEHDACGVAFVARLDGSPSHETLERARNLDDGRKGRLCKREENSARHRYAE